MDGLEERIFSKSCLLRKEEAKVMEKRENKSKVEEILFWSISEKALLDKLHTNLDGLTSKQAQERFFTLGENTLRAKKQRGPWQLFLEQFKSPIILMLLFASVISIAMRDYLDSSIILVIIFLSSLLGFYQEYHAGVAVHKLMDLVSIKATVRRAGAVCSIPVEEVVPGDIILLKNGSVVPADCRLLKHNHLRIDESSLTGESLAVEKEEGVLPDHTSLSSRSNCLWMGTYVVGGMAEAVVVHTGFDTEFGKISEHLQQKEPESEFESGIRRFGNMLMQVTIFILLIILLFNHFMGKPFFDSFMFALALAVGMTPQLLPAIISVNLSYGAREMAKQKVIVKKLSSIEDFGSMDVLCSDKTGTITVGKIGVEKMVDVYGRDSSKVRILAYLNAALQDAYENPMDDAIKHEVREDISSYTKVGEIPYNFSDKVLSVMVKTPKEGPFDGQQICVTKGAVQQVLSLSSHGIDLEGKICPMEQIRSEIEGTFQELSQEGMRLVGIAYGPISSALTEKKQVKNLIFAGFICFLDPLKAEAKEAIENLKNVGVSLKIISGDNQYVASYIASQLQLDTEKIVTGEEVRNLSDAALERKVQEASVFAEIEPNQKERIVLAFKRSGSVVGFMGDGINDASAIHVADVGISVNTAADVAKEAANIVLLEQDLRVLTSGILAGRKTFANTLKYIFMATSANFGNMFSMAGASLILPFLPLRSTQVLLTNLLTDLPQMQIATDNVDQKQMMAPQRWNIRKIQKFMLIFGPLSSIFDYTTFAILMWMYHASEPLFQTGWFMESIISACMVAFVIRTPQPFFKSRPGKGLVCASVGVILLTILLPYSPVAKSLGFIPYSPKLLAAIFMIVAMYLFSAEQVKRWFYKRVDR